MYILEVAKVATIAKANKYFIDDMIFYFYFFIFKLFICCIYNQNNLLCLVGWLVNISIIYLISKSQLFFSFQTKEKIHFFPFLVSLMFL